MKCNKIEIESKLKFIWKCMYLNHTHTILSLAFVPFPRPTFNNQTRMLIATNPNNIEIVLSIVNSLNVIFSLEFNLHIAKKKRM
jgi:hypothetical protein